MRSSTVFVVALCIFTVLTSLYETSEGFVISLQARREQIKAEKRKEKNEEKKLERRLKKLLNKKMEADKKLKQLRAWVKKYKLKQKSKPTHGTGRFPGADH